jgi:hypothetical protein
MGVVESKQLSRDGLMMAGIGEAKLSRVFLARPNRASHPCSKPAIRLQKLID